MAEGPHYHDGEIHRREHNDIAMAKRVLNVGFDYEAGEYAASGTLKDGRVPVFTDPTLLEELKEQTKLLKLLVKHMEYTTEQVYSEEDIEDDNH